MVRLSREPGLGEYPRAATCCLHRGGQLPILLGCHKLAIGRTQGDAPITPLEVKVAAGIPGGDGTVRWGQRRPQSHKRAGLAKGTLTWWRQWTARPQWLSVSSTCPCECGRRTFWCLGRSPAGKSPGRSLHPDWPTGPYLRGKLPAGTRSPALTRAAAGLGGCCDPAACRSEGSTQDPGRVSPGAGRLPVSTSLSLQEDILETTWKTSVAQDETLRINYC